MFIQWIIPLDFIDYFDGIYTVGYDRFSDFVIIFKSLLVYETLFLSIRGQKFTIEPFHEIMVFFVLRKLILQTRLRSHPVGLDVWFFVLPYFMCANREGSGETGGCAGSPPWAFAGRLCDKYHNLMSWLIQNFLPLLNS